MDKSLNVPRFYVEYLNPRLSEGDIGDSFQRFVYELLLFDYPNLHFFPARGKDGGIDLIQPTTTSRLVVECKYVGKDGLDEAQSRWRSVANNLAKHIADPAGPTKFQAQYGPWYRTKPPIGEYLFCVSSVLANQDQIDQLEGEIAQFFAELGAAHDHLAYLTKLSVKVIDWNDLCGRLQRRPHIIFRWFPLTRPQGLMPLDESPDRGTFRSYLSSDKLPYYGRGQHLNVAPAPQGILIPDEEGLLDQLKDGTSTGLIITGSGGIGKTRLTLEIGRLAQRKDWMALRVQSRLRNDAIEHLAERITPDTSVLLLIDYIETQRDFAELIETLNDFNDTYSLRIRYVANCRTSYYQAVAATPHHRQVDLSPIDQSLALRWIEGYQQEAVRHILKNSGIEITDEYLKVCNDIPILAVFVS